MPDSTFGSINYISTGGTPQYRSLPAPSPGIPISSPSVAPIPLARITMLYKERWPRSPRFRSADNSSDCTRQYIVPWEASFDAVKDLLGYPAISPLTGGGRFISRYIPDYFPSLWSPPEVDNLGGGRPYLYCTNISELEGADLPDNKKTFDDFFVCRFQNGFLTAQYETLTYDVMDDYDMVAAGNKDSFNNPDESFIQTGRYVTIQPGPGTKYQTFPQGSFILIGDVTLPLGVNGQAYPGTPGRTEMECDFEITWHQVPTAAVPLRIANRYIATTSGGVDYVPAIEDCLGSVNQLDFAGCKKGTLLLTGVVMKRIRSAIGMRLWDITYRFKWFGVRSVLSLPTPAPGGYSYGHNLVLYIGNGTQAIGGGEPRSGYYEIVSKEAASTSNYLLASPKDYQNIFRFRPFANLFRVPQLKMDPGNT